MSIEDPESSLEHQCPETHLEAQFAAFVKSIPKRAVDHRGQGGHIRKLVESAGWKVRRILDVGAGEGTFTELVLELLQQNGACGEYGELEVHIIEKDDVLWEECQRRLQRYKTKLIRVEVSALGYPPFELPNDRAALLAFADRWLAQNGPCDLIIASHVTYYFDNGGAELAYALGSRLLNSTGFMWFVVRDRNCPFYQYRDELLAHHHLPDIHRECFSDAFLDRLRCLVESPDANDRKTIVPQRRGLALEVKAGRKAKSLVSYLMWLSGLKKEEVREAALRGGQKDGFSETHVWISPIPRVERESRVLAAVHVAASCIDLLRRVAPDIETHAISFAEVWPRGEIPAVKPEKRVDLKYPIIMPSFDISSVGYACEHGAAGSANPTSQFFEKNTSFLFYRRFFFDYQVIPPGRGALPGAPLSFSLVNKVPGKPRFDNPRDYPRRTITIAAPPGAPAVVLEKRGFKVALNDWVEAVSGYYCETKSKTDLQLWSICVGCNIMPELREFISKTQILNNSCAIFLTVSTAAARDLTTRAPDFSGQIKARLAQWVAESLYLRLKNQIDELNKHKQMLELMARPLRGISEALSGIQSHSQELRSLMFEPEEALFASHHDVEPFFREGQSLPIKFTGAPGFLIRHSPDKYEEGERKLVLACVMCAVFGKLELLTDPKASAAQEDIIARAEKFLSESELKSASVAVGRMSKDLKWLVGLGKYSPISAILFASALDQIKALRLIKVALFSPFKAGSRKWQKVAFQLLKRSDIFRKALGGDDAAPQETNLPDRISPITYAAVLAFVRDVAAALTNTERQVTSLEWTGDENASECSIQFSEEIANDEEGLNRKYLKKVLELVAERCPAEWRIHDDNYGDSTRPFVYLVNKILGLGPEGRGEWSVAGVRLLEHEVFAVAKVGGDSIGARFSIAFDSKARKISLHWAQATPGPQ